MVKGQSVINIAFLIDTISCDTAGTQKQLLETIRRIDKQKFKPLLVCLWRSEWMDRYNLPCEYMVLGYSGFLKWNFPRVVRRLANLIDEGKIDILQTFFEDSIFVGFLAKLLVRNKFILLSSRRDMGLGKENQPWYHALFVLALPWVNRYFNGIIANCEAVRQYVTKRERTSVTEIKVIRNGVDVPTRSVRRPILFDTVQVRCVWVGFVASLTPVKRHDLLVHAVAELKDKEDGEKIQVVLLGEGPEYKRLKHLTVALGVENIFYFVGAVNDVASYLYHLDIGVLCSDREGLSNAILEYMACGLPVVATSVGGNMELVDSKNGICCPKGDYHAFAEALLKLVKNEKLRGEMGVASLRKIDRFFSWKKTMLELEGYYAEIMGRVR